MSFGHNIGKFRPVFEILLRVYSRSNFCSYRCYEGFSTTPGVLLHCVLQLNIFTIAADFSGISHFKPQIHLPDICGRLIAQV